MIEDLVNPECVFLSLKDEGFDVNTNGQIKVIRPLLDWPELVPKQYVAIHTGMPVRHVLDLGRPRIESMPLQWDSILVGDVTQDQFSCNNNHFVLSDTEIYIHSEPHHLFVGFLININKT